MRAMCVCGALLSFAAVCALEGDSISLMQAIMMTAVGAPMAIVGAFRSGICE